jgi:hypothetical protein
VEHDLSLLLIAKSLTVILNLLFMEVHTTMAITLILQL